MLHALYSMFFKDVNFNTLFLFWTWTGTRMCWSGGRPVVPFGWPWSRSSFFANSWWRRSRATPLPVSFRRWRRTRIRSFSWGRRAPVGPGAGSSLIERQSRRFIKGRSEDCPVPKSKQDCDYEDFRREYLLLTQKASGSTINKFYLHTIISSLNHSK